MGYLWDDIAREWSLVAPGPFTREEVVEAFNALADLKGKAWLEQQKNRSRGNPANVQVAAQVVDLWRVCRYLVDQPELPRVVARLAEGDVGATAAAAVLRLAAHSARVGVHYELEDGDDSPCLRFYDGKRSVECRCGNASLAGLQHHLYELARSIGNSVVRINTSRHLELFLAREPTAQEAGTIKSAAIRLGRSRQQPVERHFPGLGTLFSSHSSMERLSAHAPALLEPRPRVQAVVFHRAPDSLGRAQSRRFTVQIPCTEERILDLLEEEEMWFSEQGPGVLLFDVSSLPGGLERWSNLFRLCLSVGGFSAIGAVVLLEVRHAAGGVQVDRVLLRGSLDAAPLPRGVWRLLGSFGRGRVKVSVRRRPGL